MSDTDKSWIQQVAKNRTFADIGSLWGAVNERVSTAIGAGAAHATMIDIQEHKSEWWRAFEERMTALGIANYSCLRIDTRLSNFHERVGVYDVVHCSGIINHLPDPLQLILSLRRITREYLVLTGMYVPEQIENAEGQLDLSGGAAILAHAMTGKPRDVIVRHFEDLGLRVGGITVPLVEALILPDGRSNTSPWWWLMTPSLLRSMLEIAGLEVIEEGDSWAQRSRSFFCRVKAG